MWKLLIMVKVKGKLEIDCRDQRHSANTNKNRKQKESGPIADVLKLIKFASKPLQRTL